jgi:transposase
LTATALIASIGRPSRFRSGRHMAAFMGLVPREHSSANRRHLGAISKRGDPYLRMLLTHGTRSVLLAAGRKKNPDRLGRWALRVKERRGHNRATIALANKLARLSWVVWLRHVPYHSTQETF